MHSHPGAHDEIPLMPSNRLVSRVRGKVLSPYHIPQRFEDLSQTDLALEIIAVVGRHLNHRDIQGLLGREHKLEGNPDSVVNAALDALSLDSRLD